VKGGKGGREARVRRLIGGTTGTELTHGVCHRKNSSNRICDRPTGGPGDYSKRSGKVAANGKGQLKAIKCRSRILGGNDGHG
jgi:hypothetical protein